MLDPNDLVYLDTQSGESGWTNYISAFRTRAPNDKMSKQYSIEPRLAKTDTGESCIYIPSEYYN